MKIIPKLNKTKRHLCASGSILLPLAQKWGLMGVVACGLSIIGAGNVSAAELTITIPGNLSVDIMPSAEGSVAESTPAQLKISSDAPWGYTLSVKSSTDSNALMNGQNLLSSISSKLNDKNSFSNNTWGFKFTGGSASDNKYWPGPTSSLTTLDNVTTTEPITNKSEKQYNFTIATKVDNTIAAGTYTGAFTFAAVANSADYTINFNMRDGDNGPKIMQGSTQDATVKLASSIPANGDHVFLGWCDQEVTGNGPCDGTIYQPDENYVLKSANENTTLYALYDGDVVYMQNWKGCTKYLPKNTQFTLTDKRDDREYYVAKLVDDNCWMTENLDYNLSTEQTLTPENSDVRKPVTPIEPTKNSDDTTWKSKNVSSTSETDNGEYEPQSYDPGNLCWNGKYAVEACEAHDSSHYHVGNFYNFTAAMAMNDSSNIKTNQDNPNTSICPSGWQLPNGAGDKSMPDLYEKTNHTLVPRNYPGLDYQESTIEKEPYYYPYSGWWRGTWRSIGSDSVYWANNIVSSMHADCLALAPGACKFPMGASARYEGFLVRCVARE